MEIHFLGVGEACDGNQPNTSILIKTDAGETRGRILLDCGFSVPHSYISKNPPPEELETLWVSHFHGDHFFGIPLLLLWFWEMNRSKPLNIIGPPGVKAKIEQAMDLAYPNFTLRLGYPILYHEVSPGKSLQISNTILTTAYNEHSQPCLSLRLDILGKSIFYSGDGRPTPETQALANGCTFIIHEAYGLEDTTPGHGSLNSSLDFARKSGAKQVALVHMQRNFRIKAFDIIKDFQFHYPDLKILLPEKNDTLLI